MGDFHIVRNHIVGFFLFLLQNNFDIFCVPFLKSFFVFFLISKKIFTKIKKLKQLFSQYIRIDHLRHQKHKREHTEMEYLKNIQDFKLKKSFKNF